LVRSVRPKPVIRERGMDGKERFAVF
jgi:hypothetical protein